MSDASETAALLARYRTEVDRRGVERPAGGRTVPPEPVGVGAAAAFRPFDLVSFLAEQPPDYDYLLHGLLEYGELCWLAGRGKVGKSMLALFLLNACLADRETFLGREVGRVDWGLYIDAENREATVRRRVHLAGMTPEIAGRIDYRSVRGVDLGSPEGLEALRALVDRPGRGLVVLDSLVALHRADEDKATEVRQFADKLRAVFEPFGVTVLGLAHENRGGNLRGSLDWINAADRVLEIVKQTDGARELRIGDVRDGAEDEAPASFRFVAETSQMGQRRLLLETLGSTPSRSARTMAEQVADQVVLLLQGDSTLTKAKVARTLGYAPDHGTFKRAWTRASSALAEQGGQSGPA